MPRFLVYLLYNLLLPFVLLFGIPGYIFKGIKRGNLRRNFAQRFGNLPDEIKNLESKPLWVHAVSVGEVLVAAKIIRAILQMAPEKKIVLTTTTTTGYRVAEKELGNRIIVLHNPVDLPPVVAKVVKQINPEKLILVESEVWPNLVRYLHKRNVPVLLANARLSPRSEGRYLKVKPVIEPIFSLIDRTSVPFESDVARWTALGIAKDTITVPGSVKIDESVASSPEEKIAELTGWLKENGYTGGPIFLAGSTHAGEEKICARVWQELREKHPDLALVIVPRHAERAPDFKPELEALGLHPVSRSNRVQSTTQQGTVYVSDTTGELRAWFHLASVVFIGKSLAGKGGQNPFEPILAGCPVIVGPNMQNFHEMVSDLVAKKGITQVPDESGLKNAVDQFLDNPEEGVQQAARGKAAMDSHQGAALRTARWILNGE
ncbi:MAG: glycosyltransferase N-terminal domain-containing protein [Verrucomicrobiales bacterium]|nr:glycosyltransferase N-terminal domain-containing protein [Verrucomicrobiales bacterium]